MFHSSQLNKQQFYTIISIIWLGTDSIGMLIHYLKNVHSSVAIAVLIHNSKTKQIKNIQCKDLKQRKLSKGSQIVGSTSLKTNKSMVRL